MKAVTGWEDYDSLVREIDVRKDALRLAGAVAVTLELGWREYALVYQKHHSNVPDGPQLKTFLGIPIKLVGIENRLAIVAKHSLGKWVRRF